MVFEAVPHNRASYTVPYGTALLECAAHALRARLRSHRPSGTFRTASFSESAIIFILIQPRL
jgi:hypothetical protein